MNQASILTLQVPNPFSEGRNCVYVILSDPVTLIDSGVATERGSDALVRGLAAHGLSLAQLGRVILTHKHIDHIGNAWRVQRASGAEILIHESEQPSISDVDPDSQRFSELVRQRLGEWSVPDEVRPRPAAAAGITWDIEPAVPTGLADGQRIELEQGSGILEVIHTPGHTYGSICLKYGRTLFSGDHVLPEISPNIGGGDMRRRGLLTEFLGSLRRISNLSDAVDQVLPGHGAPFTDLGGRCAQLLEHHRDRLDRVEAIVRTGGPQNVWDIACRLFGELQDFHVVLGCAEAEAHLECLVDEGRVVGRLGRYRCA
jgi:hydroxyacylglutathione hydrolase